MCEVDTRNTGNKVLLLEHLSVKCANQALVGEGSIRLL